jgi:nucleotide-binding universal stress UspA family protein/predicted GNAT family acetyltransferase
MDRLLGSVSEGVVRGAGTDVLVVRERAAGPLLARLLIATDLSSASIEVARRVADAGGGGTLLHVGPAAPDALAPLAAELGLEAALRQGAVVPAIIEAAIEERATVIALGRVGAEDAAAGIALGRVAEGVALAAPCPVLVGYPHGAPSTVVRELCADEFPLADEVWRDYHGTRGDPAVDRIFGLFVDGVSASLARCRRHPDGYEVDAVFTPVRNRGRGYARRVVAALVEACHNEELFMYAVAGLERFYADFGFAHIPEDDLPQSVRDRYGWAMGDMESAEVTPMRRPAGWYARGD